MTLELDLVELALRKQAEDHTPEDLMAIIAYLRAHRNDHEAGVKPKKADEVDISRVLVTLKPKIAPVAPGKRRF